MYGTDVFGDDKFGWSFTPITMGTLAAGEYIVAYNGLQLSQGTAQSGNTSPFNMAVVEPNTPNWKGLSLYYYPDRQLLLSGAYTVSNNPGTWVQPCKNNSDLTGWLQLYEASQTPAQLQIQTINLNGKILCAIYDLKNSIYVVPDTTGQLICTNYLATAQNLPGLGPLDVFGFLFASARETYMRRKTIENYCMRQNNGYNIFNSSGYVGVI